MITKDENEKWAEQKLRSLLGAALSGPDTGFFLFASEYGRLFEELIAASPDTQRPRLFHLLWEFSNLIRWMAMAQMDLQKQLGQEIVGSADIVSKALENQKEFQEGMAKLDPLQRARLMEIMQQKLPLKR